MTYYQHGLCYPSLPVHRAPLEAVLSSWFELVDHDTWPVDANSVAGGEVKWRLADTREHAAKFQADSLCHLPEAEEIRQDE